MGHLGDKADGHGVNSAADGRELAFGSEVEDFGPSWGRENQSEGPILELLEPLYGVRRGSDKAGGGVVNQ